MKQQEILKKIGNILKELNEQYDYLQSGETHLNDLELELFAANAKFLTDHTEILRKVNAQNQNLRLTLPEHTETEARPVPAIVEETHPIELPAAALTEATLPPLAESAITYEPYTEPIQEPELMPAEAHNHEPATEYFHPFVEEKSEPEISIEPAHNFDNYSYTRQQPQVSAGDDHHDFSISSHREEEPVYPHVDLTAPTEPQANTVEETPAPTLPEHEEAPLEHEPALKEPGPTIEEPEPAPVEAYKPLFAPQPEPVETVSVSETASAPEPQVYEHVTSAYSSPITEIPKAEPEPPLTLNERLSAQLRPNTGTAASSQQGQTITDIKSAINLNDKMLFVKDLFNGYSLAYSEAIELLNRCKSFEEADRFLKSNYVTKNSWADKAITVDKFYTILHRRFPA